MTLSCFNMYSIELSDPPDFLQRIQELYQSDEESFDTLDFKDGRVFERCSLSYVAGNGSARPGCGHFTKSPNANRRMMPCKGQMKSIV